MPSTVRLRTYPHPVHLPRPVAHSTRSKLALISRSVPQALLSAGDLRPVHLVDARSTVCFAAHGDDLLQVRLRDFNSFALAAYRGIPTSITIATTLRSDGHPPPRKTRFPAAGPALPDGIGYPQGFNERFRIFEMILRARASWRKDATSFHRSLRSDIVLNTNRVPVSAPRRSVGPLPR